MNIVKEIFNRMIRKRINQLELEFEAKISKIIPKTKLDHLEVHLTEHCNLRCKCCNHFSPLAEESSLDIETFTKDFTRLSELTGGDITNILLLGGEPLLHPHLKDFFPIGRRLFPASNIILITNGILLLSQSESFWNSCKENDIKIVTTKYPFKQDYEKMQAISDSYGVKFELTEKDANIKTIIHFPLDLEGQQNVNSSFINCLLANTCIFLDRGKLYTCTVAPNIVHFNKYFKKNIPLTKKDYIDIYENNDIDEILHFLAKPIPFCKYCNVKGRTPGHKWGTSKKELNEWTTLNGGKCK